MLDEVPKKSNELRVLYLPTQLVNIPQNLGPNSKLLTM
jgi:hypothetical protein